MLLQGMVGGWAVIEASHTVSSGLNVTCHMLSVNLADQEFCVDNANKALVPYLVLLIVNNVQMYISFSLFPLRYQEYY